MNSADVYTEVNQKTDKYSHILDFLQEHSAMLQWGPEEVVLDAGCGPGDITAQVLQHWLPQDYRLLLGVDVSTAMIRHAQAVNASERVKFMTMDMDAELFDDSGLGRFGAGFDKVFSFYVLHWMQNLDGAIRNLNRLMKPGGQALVTFPIDRSFQKTFRQVHDKDQWRGYFENVVRKTPPYPSTANPTSEFQYILQKEGFQISKCEVKNYYCYFDSAEGFKGLIESLDPDIGCVPSPLKQQYLDDCLEVMEAMEAVKITDKNVRQTKIMLTSLFSKPKLD